jgi:hypothetical protein
METKSVPHQTLNVFHAPLVPSAQQMASLHHKQTVQQANIAPVTLKLIAP